MNSDLISKSILNELEDVVYIADINTYELYYINAVTKKILGTPLDEQWRRQKCYKILQGVDEPCSFCTNHKLNHEKFYNWEHYNQLLNTYYDIQDKLVTFEGIEARLEIAKDITARKLLEKDLTKKLEEQQVLNQCVGTLHTSDSPDISINKLLELVAKYYHAERGYIFELGKNDTVVDNTYEWCEVGVEPQIQLLQDVDSNVVADWFVKYREVGEFYIDSLTEELEPNSPEFEILDMQGIDSLITAPLYNVNGTFKGFLGVDNPRKDIGNTSVIRTVSNFVADFLDKNARLEELNRYSYFDSLTGMRNRHSYSDKILRLTENVPDTLGVIYIDINGLKAMNDMYGHKEGDAYITSLSDFLVDLYEECAFRIGGDEFVMLCENKEEWCFYNKLGILTEFINEGKYPKAAIGFCWRINSCNAVEQIEIADSLMYRQKEEQYKKYRGQHEIFRSKYLVDASHHN